MNHGSTWTDAELDRILGAYFGSGPTNPRDRVAESALLEIATTPQEGTRLVRLAAAITGPPPAAWAAAVVVLAIAIGLLIAFRPVGTPKPSPSPTSGPNALVLVTSESDGYEMLIPTSWDEVPPEYSDTRHWVGSDGELMISYGTSIFDGGAITVCGPPLSGYDRCTSVDNGYSIPFDPESDGVGPIDLAVWLDLCGGCPVTSAGTTLGGEAAGRDRQVVGGRQVTYVTTFHHRRPVIVYWSEPAERADAARLERMRASFRFIDAASGEPFVDPTELVLHVDEASGYQMLVPRFWEESATTPSRLGEPLSGVTMFGSGGGAGTRNYPGLTISVGDADGSIYLCQPSCAPQVATTLDALGAVLVSTQTTNLCPSEIHGTLMLGGEQGHFERPNYRLGGAEHGAIGIGVPRGGGNCLGAPAMRYQAYVFHGGRPVVLAFDYWNIGFARIQPDYVVQMLESFAFLD